MRERQKGFSLIELLVVVAIILIIAAMAIPNFMGARMAANESVGVASLRTINTSQVTYFNTYNQGYAPNLTALGPPPPGTPGSAANADLLDATVASGAKSGYGFGTPPCAGPACAGGAFATVVGGPGIISYALGAGPLVCGRTGKRDFFTDESQILRGESSCITAATVNSPPIPPR